ncbi:hypothetical protein [Kribbella sp. NPDC048928]|uniref:hypothetical protein n=1 Tax=Kribbella sp. NPDC048928 TaxID=3364111 RepID=UPI003724A64F
MSTQENLFLRSRLTTSDEARALQELLALEPIPNASETEPDEYGLRGPARTVDGVVGYLIQPNHHTVPDPGPEDRQAIDGYPVQIDIWLGRSGVTQPAEARAVFDRLVRERPETPMLLCHDLDVLIAAYRPGRAVQEFAAGTTIDAPDIDQWRDWVEG